MTTSQAWSAQSLLRIRETFARQSNSPGDREWVFVRYPDADANDVAIFPSKMPTFLFRGQNRRYIPCLPTLARGITPGHQFTSTLPSHDQALIVERVARRFWFLDEMKRHPAAKWMASKKVHGFDMPPAQHYGIPTGYIDLTELVDVACFFATCYQDEKGKWLPCFDGEGVLYILPTESLQVHPGVLSPVGLQPFPRPHEQFAWVLATGIGVDFENVRGLQVLRFKQSHTVSKFFLERFRDGSDLFPDDILAQISNDIRASSAIPSFLLERIIHDLQKDSRGISVSEDEILAILTEEFGISGRKVPRLLTARRQSALQREWKTKYEKFFEQLYQTNLWLVRKPKRNID